MTLTRTGSAVTAAVNEASVRMIFLNTQACDNKNFELMKELDDPGN